MKKLLILSGKGGTGKTTIAGAFSELLQAQYIVDCDVEAPNLHLLYPDCVIKEVSPFYSLPKAVISADKCIVCGACQDECRFEAVRFNEGSYIIDPLACEGCKVCTLACPVDAIEMKAAIGGKLLSSEGNPYFFSAKLQMGTGNSGLLVTLVKAQLEPHAKAGGIAVVDGPPGIGCPVIASMKGIDFLLLVSEPSLSGLSDLKRILQLAERFKLPSAILINKADLHQDIATKIEDYAIAKRIPFVGKIPYDQLVVDKLNEGKTILTVSQTMRKTITAIFDKTMRLMEEAL